MMMASSEYGGFDIYSATELADNDVKVFEEIRAVQEEEDKEDDSVIVEEGTGKAS